MTCGGEGRRTLDPGLAGVASHCRRGERGEGGGVALVGQERRGDGCERLLLLAVPLGSWAQVPSWGPLPGRVRASRGVCVVSPSLLPDGGLLRREPRPGRLPPLVLVGMAKC